MAIEQDGQHSGSGPLTAAHLPTDDALRDEESHVPRGDPVAETQQSRTHMDQMLQELHERLTSAVDALTTGDDWRRALEFAAKFRARSFNNTLLIWAQHSAAYERGLVAEPVPTFVAGFRQWQALEHRVLKGQPGYMIMAPVTGRFAAATPDDAESWRRLGRFERPRPGEVVRSRLVGVRPAYVWDLSQTSGPPIPIQPVPELLEGGAPAGLWDELARLVAEAGFALTPVANAAEIGGANGRTDFSQLSVAVRTDMDAAARVKTLSHELAHIRMHGPNHDALSHRGVGEVEAESVALMVGAAHGMDTSIYTIPYVSSWAAAIGDKTATEIVQQTGERVRRTAAEILGRLATPQLGTGSPPALDQEPPQRDAWFAPENAHSAPRTERVIRRGLS